MEFWISVALLVFITVLSSSSSLFVNAQLLPIPRVIVSLGDSYASGNGAGNYVGVGECFRSTSTWGAQFTQSIGTSTTFINRACSGGRFAEIVNDRFLGTVAKDVNGSCPSSPPGSDELYTNNVGSSSCNRYLKSQIQTLNSTVDLVLFAMGGNDMQFENLVKKCLIGGLRDASDCQNQINFVRNNAATWTQQLTNVLNAMAPLLKPTARVIVLQFPHIIQNTPFIFTEIKIFGTGDSIEITNNLRSLGSVLDDGQRAAIAAANQAANRTFVLYYDQVKAVFEGHEPHPSAFTNNPSAWIYEGSAPLNAEIYHLNPTGHTQLANALFNYVVPLVSPIPAPVPPPVVPAAPTAPVPTPVVFSPVQPPAVPSAPAVAPVPTSPIAPAAGPVSNPSPMMPSSPVVSSPTPPVPTPIAFSPVPPPVIMDPVAPVAAPTRRGGFFAALFRFFFGWLF